MAGLWAPCNLSTKIANMQNQIKFTSDGKKVIIVGQLNAQETIVQEIFITQSGAEIPSGENFVVKSLHDEPAVSWKEQSLRDLEKRYEVDRKSWETKIDQQRAKLKRIHDQIESHIEAIGKVAELSSEKSFRTLANFLSGKIKYLVTGREYGCIKIQEWDSFAKSNEYGMKLISLFGKGNGDLLFKIHSYSDGSGSTEIIYPFCEYQEAVEFARNWFSGIKYYSKESIALAKHHGFDLDAEKLEAYNSGRLKDIEKYLSQAKKDLAEREEALKNYTPE